MYIYKYTHSASTHSLPVWVSWMYMPHLENGPWLTLHLYRAQGGHDWFCPLCFNGIIVSHVVEAHTCTSLTAPMKWNLSLPLEYMHFGRDAAVCFCPKCLLLHQMAHSTSCSSFISSCTLKLDHIGTCTKYNLCVGGRDVFLWAVSQCCQVFAFVKFLSFQRAAWHMGQCFDCRFPSLLN